MGEMQKSGDSRSLPSQSDEHADRTTRRIPLVLLVMGAALIIGVSIFTLTRLTDRTVFTVLVPGAVVGLVLVVVGFLWDSRERQETRHPWRPNR